MSEEKGRIIMGKIRKRNSAGKEKPKKSLQREILEWVATLLAAVLLAMVLRTFVFELVKVDGRSMNDTLADGEIMLVTKFRYSSTWLSFPWQSDEAKENAPRFTVGGDPARFDVVICRYPGRGDTNFVKRVVGLPGDTVALKDGYLYVNGEKYDEPYINEAYRKGYINEFPEYTVPEGEYFVMGDHRNNSNDSRAQGPISRNMIVGHVVQVLFPFSGWRGVPNGLDVK